MPLEQKIWQVKCVFCLNHLFYIWNEQLVESVSPEILEIIILHELYHCSMQNLTINMKHITHTREQFGIQVQNELDIDSDTEVFKF